jgi:hypothetical protein
MKQQVGLKVKVLGNLIKCSVFNFKSIKIYFICSTFGLESPIFLICVPKNQR